MAVKVNSEMFIWGDGLTELIMQEPFSLMGYYNQIIKNEKGEHILLAPAYYLFYQEILDDYEEDIFY